MTEHRFQEAPVEVGVAASPDFLNNTDVVEGLVQSFAAEVVRRFDENGFLEWLQLEAGTMNLLFSGYPNDPPARFPFVRNEWNTPQQVGAWVARELAFKEVELHKAVELAFLWAASELVDVLIANAENDNVEQWAWQMEGITERLGHALLGLPYDKEVD